jgi:ABC-type Fe3+/spermidine/putrescine transport system ATPase subunit
MLMIRPERIQVRTGPSTAAGENGVQARVEDIVFSRGISLCFCRDASDRQWKARYVARMHDLSAGQEVYLHWNAEAVAMLSTG